MKKIITLCIFGWFFLFATMTFVYAQSDIEKIVIHYYRYDKTYDGYNIWLWEKEPANLGGKQFDFNNTDVDEYGAWIEINLSENYPNTTKFGIIIKKGAWDGYREPGGDRFFKVSDMEIKDKKVHAYFVEQDLNIGLSSDDLANNIPDYSPRILSSFFSKDKKINAKMTEKITKYEVFEDNIIVQSGTNSTDSLLLTPSFAVNLSKLYTIKVTFSNDSVVSKAISIHNLYDTVEFEDAYTYTDKLGAIYSKSQTIFRIWAPISDEITLNLYEQGHPNYSNNGNMHEEKLPYKTYSMNRISDGAWEVIVPGDLANKYYTFSVTNYGTTNEVTDPYSYSTGVNGLRSMVVDFSATNPDGWNYSSRPDTIKNLTDYIVYELHVRDLTSHETWNGNEEYRGKFLGFTETGTTYTNRENVTVTTGIDHIAELGVNAVQLLPIFDFGYIDEAEMATNPNYANTFNWGYMPYHFNTLEGSYSINPFDGASRINEFKQLVNALHEKDIRVIMDVVYNHTGESESSNFNKILPGYYHRLTSDGGYSNGSGTGNETASERSMVRNFMLDSIKFLATEYNLSGFRFDLMALHDVETMNQIESMLHEIDPTIVIYGEPWDAGDAAIDSTIAADKDNLSKANVGAFNDVTRDAIKGSVFTANEGAWLQGLNPANYVEGVKYGIVGGVDHSEVSVNKWHLDPNKTINYVSAHDNNTLYDKLRLTGVPTSYIEKYQIQANAIVLTSQGIPFLHAGVDFMRSKPKEDGSGYDENSYESSDKVNQLRWDRKAEYNNVFEYYKTLIAIRKNYAQFRMNNADDIINSIKFINTNNSNIIAYEINNPSLPSVIVIHSGKVKSAAVINLPSGKSYRQLTDYENASLISPNIITGVAVATPNTSIILIENSDVNASVKESTVKIKKNESFNPLNNIDYDATKQTVYTSSFYNTSVAGSYQISAVVVDTNGNTLLLEYKLIVEGSKHYKINLKGEITV
ncbi:MAG: type I pullulanase [Acholeplasma sp.]|nr:type I pullulanase [Acholeplasma sp.]